MEEIHFIDADSAAGDCGFAAGAGDRGFAAGDTFRDDDVIDVEAEEIGPEDTFQKAGSTHAGDQAAGNRRLADCFNTETNFHGQSLAQLAVRSLSIVDYVRGLGQTEMADGDLESLVRCADDLESAIILMFQLAGGTRMELRQRYEMLRMAIFAQAAGQPMPADMAEGLTVDIPRRR